MKLYFAVVMCLCFSLCLAQDKTVYLASLEWPPYTGSTLPHEGASVAVVRSMYKSMGYKVVVDYMPWSDTVRQGMDESSKYSGYFPVYRSKQRDGACAYSEPIGFSALGFAYHQEAYFPVKSLDDLSKVAPIGVVTDYANHDSFDARVKLGEILVAQSATDADNLKKLAQRKLPMVVIDEHVMHYLLKNDAELKPYSKQLQFHEWLLDEKRLYVCFKSTEMARHHLNQLNKGEEKVNMRRFFKESLR